MVDYHSRCAPSPDILNRYTAALADTVGKTGTHVAKVISDASEAEFICAGHDVSTLKGLLECQQDKDFECVATVSVTAD